jgi:hypothetical protein
VLRSSKDYCPYCTKAKQALFSILSKEEVDVEEVRIYRAMHLLFLTWQHSAANPAHVCCTDQPAR